MAEPSTAILRWPNQWICRDSEVHRFVTQFFTRLPWGKKPYLCDGIYDRVSFGFVSPPVIRQCLADIQIFPSDPSDPCLEGACHFPSPISETNAEGIIGGGFSAEEFSKNGTAL